MLTGRWGVGGNLESDSDKRPNRRGERGCGGSLAGTEFRSMLPSFLTIACTFLLTSMEKGHKVKLGPDEFRRWAGQIAGKTDASVRRIVAGWDMMDIRDNTWVKQMAFPNLLGIRFEHYMYVKKIVVIHEFQGNCQQ